MNSIGTGHNALRSFALSLGIVAGGAAAQGIDSPRPEIGFVDIGSDIQLRRLRVAPAQPKATVLFLHGFPETLYAWKDIATSLGRDYEVHAFDWPGYGQSSRPAVERFSYAPADYARVLKAYIETARIDRSKLLIYATDIGSLPALLAAIDEPGIARQIVVGDFAPFDRPQHMFPSLQALKGGPAAEATRAHMNKTRDEILANAYRRGFEPQQQFDIAQDLEDDMARGWDHPQTTSADAFAHYYANFTRDQNRLEAQLTRLKTPVKVVWGAKDLYIATAMGAEFAERTGSTLDVLPGIGHYPHLQDPKRTVDEVRDLLGQ